MTFKQKVLLLPVVATVFLLGVLAMMVLEGRDMLERHMRMTTGYLPALDSIRQLDALASPGRWNPRDFSPEGDAARRVALVQWSGEFEKQLAHVRANPVMEPTRARELEEAFATFQDAVRRADATGSSQVMERHAALLQTLRGTGDWAQAGLERTLEEMNVMRRWLQRSILSVGLVCVLALVGCALWLAHGVVGPLTRLTEVTTRLATEGDLTQTIDLATRDELGALARGIAALVMRLRTVPVTLRDTVDELTWVAGELTAASQRQATFLGHLRQCLDEVESMAGQITQTASQTASRAEVVLKVTGQADQFSVLYRDSIESSARGLQQMGTRVAALMRGVTNLSEQTARVGQIIGGVRDLADQSNVLALNASIEAARAGDEGRGFAVVAHQMRELSGQSLLSTQRIGKIMLEINEAIRGAVSIAEQDSHQMDAEILQVLTSADRLKEITSVVHESGGAARQIVASVKQQHLGAEQLHQVIATMVDRMQAVSESTQDAEAAVGQVNRSLDRLQQVAASFRV